jgi:hypothetical protein
MPGSNLDRDIGCPERGFRGFLSLARQMLWKYPELGNDHFFAYTIQIMIHYHQIIRRYTIWVNDTIH